MVPGDGYIYFTSDAGVTGSNQTELGYFKVAYADVGNLANWTRFYTPVDLSRPSNMFHLDSDGFFMGSGYAASAASSGGGFFSNPNIIFSPDITDPGAFVEATLEIPGDLYGVKTVRLPNNGSKKRYQIIGMPSYDYFYGCISIELEFD